MLENDKNANGATIYKDKKMAARLWPDTKIEHYK
jgi:hypothetical protein